LSIDRQNEKDYLVRAITRDANIRGLALMGALLKTGQRVALCFEGSGPLRDEAAPVGRKAGI